MPRVLIATTNPHKLREIRAILSDAPVELAGLADIDAPPEPEETGETFQENARLKAVHYATATRLLTVADDSGLVVDALDGEPGVRSARFLRPDATYPERFEEIFRRLASRPHLPRTARFVCALAVAQGSHVVFETTGTVEGEIAHAAHGTRGFGYDPIFYYPPYERTFGEGTDAEKLRVDHRGRAFRQLDEWLRAGGAPYLEPEF